MADSVIELTDATFDAEVLESDKPVLVDFWATWCGPCRAIAPIVAEVADEHAEALKVTKIDTDANPTTTARYGIMTLPTLLVFQGGEVVKRIPAVRNKAALLKEIGDLVGG